MDEWMQQCITELGYRLGRVYTGVIEITEISLDDQGYTEDGEYYGIGGGLYLAACDDGEALIECAIRGNSRDAIIEALSAKYPKALVG